MLDKSNDSWVGLGSCRLERRPSRRDGVIVSAGILVVGGAGGSDFKPVAQLVCVSAKRYGIAANGHRSRHAVEEYKRPISHAVAGVRTACSNGCAGQVCRAKRLEAAGAV